MGPTVFIINHQNIMASADEGKRDLVAKVMSEKDKQWICEEMAKKGYILTSEITLCVADEYNIQLTFNPLEEGKRIDFKKCYVGSAEEKERLCNEMNQKGYTLLSETTVPVEGDHVIRLTFAILETTFNS